MPMSQWTAWPSREALTREFRHPAHRGLSVFVRVLIFAGLLWGAFSGAPHHGLARLWLALGSVGAGLAFWGLIRCTLHHRLWPSLALLAVIVAGAFGAQSAQATFAAIVLWCASAMVAMERMPLAAAVPFTALALGAYAVADNERWMATTLTTIGLGLAGYVLRLDAEARGNARRLLDQERAARVAEAETAALRERGRIAREIHDVLAHSLSAQLVHLEAARLLIERGGERDQVLERVVSARRMARQGLVETRQALSALRGEITPAEDFLRELAASECVTLRIGGERRRLGAEAGLAVRRVAQEALTNARKHAPGSKVEMSLDYGAGEVELVVRDTGGRAPDPALGASGAGYGLLGMRERAELLGGTLEAGVAEEGFTVRLRVPA
ncbi:MULTISPECIES: sensor histidine kinase [Streptomycetaceae]|nr:MULTISPECIES: histidine kinase [Streptomycetaceae]MYS61436.1 two-component sensor histidine kinase [Streptomyces sp. SID5468]CCB77292.1 putative two-component system sensor kinase [Streptantibioticus cattleyicolor NRRL 8057 = DSM 46488]